MKPGTRPLPISIWFFAALALLGGSAFSDHPADWKLQTQLIWGTDEFKPPEGKDYKPVDPELEKKLKVMLKWKHYFEVRRTPPVTVGDNKTVKAPISDKCELDIKRFSDSNVEVALFSKGKEVTRHKQALPKGEVVIMAGNAPNETSWLVVLKRIE
jgi:hypothetical protein